MSQPVNLIPLAPHGGEANTLPLSLEKLNHDLQYALKAAACQEYVIHLYHFRDGK